MLTVNSFSVSCRVSNSDWDGRLLVESAFAVAEGRASYLSMRDFYTTEIDVTDFIDF